MRVLVVGVVIWGLFVVVCVLFFFLFFWSFVVLVLFWGLVCCYCCRFFFVVFFFWGGGGGGGSVSPSLRSHSAEVCCHMYLFRKKGKKDDFFYLNSSSSQLESFVPKDRDYTRTLVESAGKLCPKGQRLYPNTRRVSQKALSQRTEIIPEHSSSQPESFVPKDRDYTRTLVESAGKLCPIGQRLYPNTRRVSRKALSHRTEIIPGHSSSQPESFVP